MVVFRLNSDFLPLFPAQLGGFHRFDVTYFFCFVFDIAQSFLFQSLYLFEGVGNLAQSLKLFLEFGSNLLSFLFIFLLSDFYYLLNCLVIKILL